jgi:inorganic triphosphatase YgiF
MSRSREIEIKLELTTEQWRRLRDRIRTGTDTEMVHPSETLTLRSIYFDTPA